MASFSEIKLTFTDDLVVGAQLGFVMNATTSGGSPISINRIWDWVNTRSTNYQITTGIITGVLGERAAINFHQAAILDMPSYTISRIGNEVTIRIDNTALNVSFSWTPQIYETNSPVPTLICTTHPSIGVNINNGAGAFDFDSVVISESDTNPCTSVKVTVTATELIETLFSPYTILNNTDDPLVFDWVRGQQITITAVNDNNQIINRTIQTPSVLSASNTNISIFNSPNGSTVTVSHVNTYGLQISYSLNGTDWQDFPFSGLSAGNYTLHVRDNFGCSFTVPFTASQFADTYSPIFYISKSNSLRFAKRIDFGDASNYKNDENTLSNEEDVKLPYRFIHDLQSADVVTIQFKSNYTTNKVVVIPPNAVPTNATSNIMIYSGDLSNAIWIKNHLILSGEKVIPDATYNYHSFLQEVNKGATAGNYTFSFYVKPVELKTIDVLIDEVGGSGLVSVGFDSLSKTFFYNYGLNGFTFISSSYTNEANGYLRVAIKMGLSTATTISIGVQIRGLSGSTDHTGDGVSGMFFDKFQLQEGDLGAYVETTSVAVDVPATDGSIEVPVVQLSSNIRAKDKRDAYVYGLGTKTYVYFQAGNLYDYTTGAITGTYALNGTLPIWARVGNYIAIGGVWALIEDTFFNEALNVDVIVFDGVYSHVSPTNIVSSIFNIQDYEVYEFEIDMVDYIDQDIRVRINADHATWTDQVYLSEQINVKVLQENTCEIKYWNSDNTDVFYGTGITHKIRPQIINKSGINDQKQESYKTDNSVKLLSADVYEGDEFIFDPVPREIMRQIVIALSHEFVFINDVGYVKNDNVDVEGPLNDTNLYSIKAKMLKNGNVYNSQSVGISNEIYTTPNAQIVGLVQTDSGFLEY